MKKIPARDPLKNNGVAAVRHATFLSGGKAGDGKSGLQSRWGVQAKTQKEENQTKILRLSDLAGGTAWGGGDCRQGTLLVAAWGQWRSETPLKDQRACTLSGNGVRCARRRELEEF